MKPTQLTMRKLLLSGFAALFAVSLAFGQTGEDQFKAAEKAYSNFTTSNDVAMLQEAVDNVTMAMEDPTVQGDYKSYIEAGDIYAAAIQQYVKDRTVAGNEPIPPMVARAASTAADYYIQGYNKAEKKSGQKAALKGLQDLQGNISNEGIYAIQDKSYDDSYAAFAKSVEVHEFLTANGGESVFTGDDTQLNEQRFFAAVSAMESDQADAAEPLYIALAEADYEEAGVYDGLYKIYSGRDDMDNANKYLEQGREKFPEATSLLFSEINYYLSRGELSTLTDKLEQAIAAEPNNVSLYATLGSVYDRLYQEKRTEEPEVAADYFEQAKANYEKGLEIEADNASLIYSLGALYFNRAAKMTEDLVELGNDFSKEGQAKYDALEAEIGKEFDIAYPYFQKAEMTDPNNLNTLIALKEIFARRDDYDASNEMKERIEKVQNQETIEKSYFAEKGM